MCGQHVHPCPDFHWQSPEQQQIQTTVIRRKFHSRSVPKILSFLYSLLQNPCCSILSLHPDKKITLLAQTRLDSTLHLDKLCMTVWHMGTWELNRTWDQFSSNGCYSSRTQNEKKELANLHNWENWRNGTLQWFPSGRGDQSRIIVYLVCTVKEGKLLLTPNHIPNTFPLLFSGVNTRRIVCTRMKQNYSPIRSCLQVLNHSCDQKPRSKFTIFLQPQSGSSYFIAKYWMSWWGPTVPYLVQCAIITGPSFRV